MEIKGSGSSSGNKFLDESQAKTNGETMPHRSISHISSFGLFSHGHSLESRKNSELYLLSGIALVWTALSFSKFKLPHYIFVVYPLIAILAAKFIHQLHTFVHVAWAQLILGVTACLTLAGLLLYSFPNGGRCVPVLLVLICLVAILYFFMSFRTDQIMIPSFLISIAIGIGLNLHFYPQLLPYQANSQVGKWVKEN
jgi:4-amino-4-deoxy-L-arabinose transferase-like glycosyltransferase